MARGTRGPVCVVLIAAQMLTSCTRWHIEADGPQALLNREHPIEIRVQEKGGTQFILDGPQIVGDSLTGTVQRVTARETREDVPRRISLAAVEHVAVRRRNDGMTVLAVVGSVALLFVGLVALDYRSIP